MFAHLSMRYSNISPFVYLFGTGEWESMAKYASHLPRDGYTDCFFKAVLSIHRGKFRQAQMVRVYSLGLCNHENNCNCMWLLIYNHDYVINYMLYILTKISYFHHISTILPDELYFTYSIQQALLCNVHMYVCKRHKYLTDYQNFYDYFLLVL